MYILQQLLLSVKNKQFLRIVVLLIIWAIWYYSTISLIRTFFPSDVSALLYWLFALVVAASITILSLTLLSIDVRTFSKGALQLVSIVLLLSIVSVIYFTHTFSPEVFLKLLSIVLIHLWFHFYLQQKSHYLTTRIETSIWWIATYGVLMFSLILSVWLALFFAVEVTKAPMQCAQIYDKLEQVTHSPLDAVQEWSTTLLDRGQQVIGLNTTQWSLWWLWDMLINHPLLQQFQDDHELVRQSFCEVIVTLINEKVSQWVWILAVVFILFILFSPLLTLWFRCIQLIIWLLLLLLRSVWVYVWRDHTLVVKQLE